MSKTPCELRLEVLKLAQAQAHQRYFQEWETAAKKADIHESVTYLAEVPQFPTTEDILVEANKMQNFVDNLSNT